MDFARSFLDDVDIHLFSGFDGGRFGQEPNRVYCGSPLSDNASDILMSDANHDLGTIFFLSALNANSIRLRYATVMTFILPAPNSNTLSPV